MAMRRFENILITVAAAAICFSALAYNFAGDIAPDVVKVPEVSNLESRTYAKRPEMSEQSFKDGTYQSALDAYIADHIPARNDVVLLNASLQRASVAASAGLFRYDVYPTFFGSRYYAVPHDGLVVERAEEQPTEADDPALDAWVNTINEAARRHPDKRFVYDCVVRHDQVEANPTYRYYDNRLNPAWVQENLVGRLDPSIDSFIDSVESYDEIIDEWYITDPHWTLERALKSYDKIADRLSLTKYPYENPVTAVDSWYGAYAKSGLDLDTSICIEDLPIDFSQLEFYHLREEGGERFEAGIRSEVLSGKPFHNEYGHSAYYQYFGGGSMRVANSGPNNGRKALVVTDSLSYCLTRYIAANYSECTFLLPGNAEFDESFEHFIEQYAPDDVIIMTHASKFKSVAGYSPAFIGLQS